MDSSVIGSPKDLLFLTVDFYDCEPIQSGVINHYDSTFNTNMLFKVRNDYSLREYIEKKTPAFAIHKVTGMYHAEIARGTLNMSPLCDHIDCFTSVSTLTSNDRAVGKINYEVQIFSPLIK